jgi:hypothetical protein
MTRVTCYLCLQVHRPLKVGVNDMPFRLKDVLHKCEPHIETTLVGH